MSLPLQQLIDSRYIAIKKLASGGVCDIYEASDRYTKKSVALKILKEEFKDDFAQIDRLENEARYASMFSYPHIIKIYNVGTYNKQMFISYELMKGKTLKDILDSRGKLSHEEVISTMKQIALAVSHIHSRGILHNDLKPDNLFKFSDGNIKLLDFGIASHIGDRNDFTAMASVKYAAPEVLQNKKYSVQSDIYSMGIILYELVTGRTPFEYPRAEDIIAAHINKKMPYTNTSFDNVIFKATDSNLMKRYQKVSDLMEDLDIVAEKINKKKGFFKRLFKRHES